MNDRRIIVMGVSGCGKSTVGSRLAEVLHCRFIDGDDLHPETNRAKMASGVPLNDDDRWPWLDLVGQTLVEKVSSASGTIIACSALKRSYRERILAAAPGTVFVHLHGSRELLQKRLESRRGHFMKAGMLQSQLDTLELLAPDEPGHVFDIATPVFELIPEIVSALKVR